MEDTKGRLLQGYRVLLVVYLIYTFYLTVVSRESSGKDIIRTEWFRDNIIVFFTNSQNLLNILLFVPIGCLVGLATKKYKLVYAVLVGLFVSETIECSQLIWKKGTFDVNDLMNNTIGALVGGVIAVAIMVSYKGYRR